MNNNNNNTINFINYEEAINSRKCWYIGCKCKSRLPAIGEGRKNGKSGKKEYENRRFHSKCTGEYESALYRDMYFIEDNNPEYNNLYKKYELERLKPEYREFLPEFKRIRALARKNNKKY